MGVNAELVKLLGPELGLLLPVLDERSRRLTLGAVARAAGDGGITAVAKLTGASWQTVADGAAELESGQAVPEGRIRRPGAGRKKLAETDPGLLPALLGLVEDSTRGDPESPLMWTTKSAKNLSGELTRQGHRCSPQTAWPRSARSAAWKSTTSPRPSPSGSAGRATCSSETASSCSSSRNRSCGSGPTAPEFSATSSRTCST